MAAASLLRCRRFLYLTVQNCNIFLRYRYKQCKACDGQNDEIDLVGHRGLLPEAVTQQCAREYAAKMRLTARSFVSRVYKSVSG